MAINNTVNKLPYEQALGNLRRDFRGSNLAQAESSLAGSYKESPVAPTKAEIRANPSKKIKGLVSPKEPLSYSSLVGGLADASKPSTAQQSLNSSLVNASRPTSTQTGLISDLRRAATGNTDIGNRAASISDKYGGEIARVGGLGASAQAGYNSTGTNVVGAGNAAIASQSASQRMQALAAGQQAALQGTAQQLTGQGQAANAFGTALGGANTQQAQQLSGLSTALGSANTQQAQQISGLGTAANLAQPQTAAYGQTVFNPLSGQYEGNSGLPPETLQQYAQMAANGQYSAIPSSITGNPVLNAQLNTAAQQINPNYSPIVSTAQGAATAANVQLEGTATPTAYNAIYQTALNDYTNLQQSVENVDQFGSLLTSNMTAGGINPSNVKYANQTLAQIRGQLSSGAQAQYDTTLAALRSKISGMLSVGGNETPTAITADAQKILDGSLPLSALNDVLRRIQQEGNVLLQTQASKVNTAKAGTQGGSPSAPSQASSGGVPNPWH